MEDFQSGNKIIRTGEEVTISKTQLILHLIPVIGFFPSLWAVYRRQASREQLAVVSVLIIGYWSSNFRIFYIAFTNA
jgi:hypothetical protein